MSKLNLSKCGQSIISENKSNKKYEYNSECEMCQNEISALTASVNGLMQITTLSHMRNQPHLHSLFMQRSFTSHTYAWTFYLHSLFINTAVLLLHKNLRPVSTLMFIYKIMESVAGRRMLIHKANHNLGLCIWLSP